MPRIRDIKSLTSFRGRKQVLSRPKAASNKAPDYVAFEATEHRTVTRGGKKVNVPIERGMVYPEPAMLSEKNICAMGKGKVGLRTCHVELVLLGKKHAPPLGKEPGAYLRFCSTANQKDAPLVRVHDHAEAQRVATSYCECKRKGGKPAACLPKPR